jgi:hypothetical protein
LALLINRNGHVLTQHYTLIRAQYAGLFEADGFPGIAQERLMIQANTGNHRYVSIHSVEGVQPTA